MLNRRFSGVSIAQYAIIIALVSIATVSAYFFLGQNINTILSDFHKSLITDHSPKTVDSKGNIIPANPAEIKGGSLGGTSEKPVKNCNNGVCVVDYGDFTLRGLPVDFNLYVQSAGTAGTTKKLLAVMDQLISQLDSSEVSFDINSLRDLSNLGHEIASKENVIEINAQQFLSSQDTKISFENTFTLDNKIRNEFKEKLAQVITPLNTVTNSTDQKALAIVEALGTEIMNISDNMANTCKDVSTGNKATPEQVQTILDLQASSITNLNSAVICATGDGNDTGETCK